MTMPDPNTIANVCAFFSGVLQSVLAGEVTRKLTEIKEARVEEGNAEFAALLESLHGANTLNQRVERACVAGLKDLRFDETEAAVLLPLFQDQIFSSALAEQLRNSGLSIAAEWLFNFPAAAGATPETLEAVAAKLTQGALRAIASDASLARILQLQQGDETRSIVRRIEPQAALLPGIDQKLNALLERSEPTFPAGKPDENAAELSDQITEAFDIASTELLSWPATLDDGRTRLESRQTEDARAGFSEPQGSTTQWTTPA